MRPIKRRDALKAAGATALTAPLIGVAPKSAVAKPKTLPGPIPPSEAGYKWPRRKLLEEPFENSLTHDQLNKRVHRKLVIDDMSTDKGWTLSGPGELSYATIKGRNGRKTRTLRLKAPNRDEAYIDSHRLPDGSFDAQYPSQIDARLAFAQPQDWSAYNRLSFWVYIEPNNLYNHVLQIQWADKTALIGGTLDLERLTYEQRLTAGKWNRVIWEIAELKRDQVTSLAITHLVRGIVAGQDPEVVYHIDDLRVEKVKAEKWVGWDLDAGTIALNHVGYLPLDSKIALAGPNGPSRFDVLDARHGKCKKSFPVKKVNGPKGSFTELDFSDFTEPGRYVLAYGDAKTHPFSIDEDVWESSIEKNFNFWYGNRCGIDIPGYHPASQYDIRATSGSVTKVVNGGWYDAGDMNQKCEITHDCILGMLALYEALPDGRLRQRVLEEARWGLNWALYIRFGPGVRSTGFQTRFFSDNIVGNRDDVNATVGDSTSEAMHFAALGSQAARIIKKADPTFAAACLKAAKEDFDDAIVRQASWADSSRATLGWAILAAIELFDATGQQTYADRAKSFGDLLVQCQEQRFLDGSSITGYFYTNPGRTEVVHDNHYGNEEAPLAALSALCEAFPDDAKWISWYSTAALHSEFFLLRGAKMSAPYRHLPNSVWTLAEAQAVFVFASTPAETARFKAQIVEQYEGGTSVSPSGDRRLRTFPIWTAAYPGAGIPPVHFKGSTQVQLASTVALSAAAGIRKNRLADNVAREQVDWVLGRNPFSRSLMFGQGYDFHMHYAGMFAPIVGSLPVGMEANGDDEPLWRDVTEFTSTEQWVEVSAKFLWAMAYMATPARVRGIAKAPVTFEDSAGRKTKVHRKGSFDLSLPADDYTVEFKGQKRELTLLGGSEHMLTLDPGNTIQLAASTSGSGGNVNVSVKCTGAGAHNVSLRVFNLQGNTADKAVTLNGNQAQTLTWSLTVADTAKPWVLVAVADGDTETAVEALGTA